MNLSKHVDINRPHMHPCSIIILNQLFHLSEHNFLFIFLLKKIVFIYLAALGLSYLTWDLLCFLRYLVVVGHELSSCSVQT